MTVQSWLYQQFVGDIPAGDARCYLCGASTPPLYPSHQGIADTFNSHYLARCPSSPWLCAACQWYLDNKAGHPDFRKMSLLIWETGWTQWQRADMRADIEGTLQHGMGEDCYLICSLSKHKHIALQAPMTAQGSRVLAVQVEEQVAYVDQSTWQLMRHSFDALVALGHNKGEILSGTLYANMLRKHGRIAEALQHSALLAPYRGGAALTLLSYATIIADKEESIGTSPGDGIDSSRGAAPESRVERDRPGVQGEVPHGHLVASREQRGGVRAHEQHAEQVSQQPLF